MTAEKKTIDMVASPPHYTAGKIECIDALESALGFDGFAGYCAGNIIKYVWRYRYKDGIESLKKARWYLDRLISTIEKRGA